MKKTILIVAAVVLLIASAVGELSYLSQFTGDLSPVALEAASKAKLPDGIQAGALTQLERELFELGYAMGYDAGKQESTPENPADAVNLDDESVYQDLIWFGEIRDVKRYDDEIMGKLLIVKVKIQSQLSNELTIKQNYFNIQGIAESGLFRGYSIQYWAVADMRDGSESKVISFDVPASTVEALYKQTIPANMLDSYVDNLWILPSLTK